MNRLYYYQINLVGKESLLADKVFFLIKPDQIDLFDHTNRHSFVFNEHEISAGRIHNSTKIGHEISSYLKKNGLCKRPGILVFDSSLVVEQLVCGQDSHIDIASHMHVKANLNQDWHYQAVLKPGMLLQYQLLFAQIGTYIEVFTSNMIFDIQYLLDHTKQDLRTVDSLIQLKELANGLELDLYAKFIKTCDKF